MNRFTSTGENYKTLFQASEAALVGNARSLLGSGFGQEIDDKPVVYRFNAAPTKGYEKDVGRRTSARWINPLLQRGNALPETETSEEWIATLSGEVLFCKPGAPNDYKKAKRLASKENELVRPKEDYKEDIYKRLQTTTHPTTGVFAASILGHYYKKLYLYGFSSYQSDVGHYWESVDTEILTQGHSPKEESALLKEMQHTTLKC